MDVPVVASDDNSTCASLLALLDEVGLLETLTLVGGLQLLGELIVANTTSVDD